jgi:hypothetical protein
MTTILVDAAGSAQVMRQICQPVSTMLPPWMIPSDGTPSPAAPMVLQ